MSPLKIFEYMAHGKPILSSDLPVLREVLEQDHNALLVDPADPIAWVKALRELADDAKLRARLGAAAHESFERHHTWTGRAHSVLEGLNLGAHRLSP